MGQKLESNKVYLPSWPLFTRFFQRGLLYAGHKVTVKHGQFVFPLHYLELDFYVGVLVAAYYLIVVYHSIYFHGISPEETETARRYNLSWK